jgi:hypothetical protein
VMRRFPFAANAGQYFAAGSSIPIRRARRAVATPASTQSPLVTPRDGCRAKRACGGDVSRPEPQPRENRGEYDRTDDGHEASERRAMPDRFRGHGTLNVRLPGAVVALVRCEPLEEQGGCHGTGVLPAAPHAR